MRLSLLPLSCALLAGCATLSSSERWTPVELVHPEGMGMEVADHTGRLAALRFVLGGAGKVATLPLRPEGLHVSIRDRGTSLWALGILIPFLPTFGLGPNEEDSRVELALRMAYEGEAEWNTEPPASIHRVDPRAVRLIPADSQEPLLPVAWSVHGFHGDRGAPLPEPGTSLTISAREPLVLFFDVTHAELEAAGECLLDLTVELESGQRVDLRLRLRAGRVWHFMLMG